MQVSFSKNITERITQVGRITNSGIAKVGNKISEKKDAFLSSHSGKTLSKNKDLIVGAGVCVTALALASACLKGIIDKIKDVHNKTKND